MFFTLFRGSFIVEVSVTLSLIKTWRFVVDAVMINCVHKLPLELLFRQLDKTPVSQLCWICYVVFKGNW